jgi:hypothetical protein
MFKQNKGSAEKPKAVSYFNEFPSNFLKPYGKADSPPDDDTVSRRTNPISGEWFLRPRIAMSEFAETLTENLKLLKDDNLTLVNTAEFATISKSVQPMLDALSRLNTKTREVPTKEDINTVMSYLYDNHQQLDKSIEEMFTVGGALFTTAIQYIVARSIISQPTKFAEKLVLENENTKEFRREKDVKALRNFLQQECLGSCAQTSAKTSKSNPRRALLKELRRCDDLAQEEATTDVAKEATSEDLAAEATTSHRKRGKTNTVLCY